MNMLINEYANKDYTNIWINISMNSHINLRTDKLIVVKTYVRIDENIKIRLNKYTNCQQL